MPKQVKAGVDDDWMTIAHAEKLDYHALYQHPGNRCLASQRPANQLCPGDRILIPDKTVKDESRITGQRHRFVVEGPKVRLRIALVSFTDRPMTNEPFRLEIPDIDLERKGRTTAEGLVDEEVPLPPKGTTQQTGWLELTRWQVVFTLHLGQLEPVSSVAGAQARLNNLNFPCGAVDGRIGRKTRAAIAEFQACLRNARPNEPLDHAALERRHDRKNGGR